MISEGELENDRERARLGAKPVSFPLSGPLLYGLKRFSTIENTVRDGPLNRISKNDVKVRKLIIYFQWLVSRLV